MEKGFLKLMQYYGSFFFFSVYNLKLEEDPRVTSLGRRSVIFWVTAVLCWVNDRLYCEAWSSIGFPYLHGIWHVLIFIAAYTGALHLIQKEKINLVCVSNHLY